MKKYLIIICFMQIGFSTLLKAQDYEPLVRDNAHWVVGDRNEMWQYYENNREYFTNGDTLHNDKLYKKVYKYQLETWENTYGPPYTRIGNPELYGLLREDTIGRIVYGIQINAEPDWCFYDEDTLFKFSVSQYDTLELCIGAVGPITFDYIYYGNIFGFFRKQFIMGGNYAGTTLIEGIGSYHGLFEWLGFAFKDTDGTKLRCYTIGDISNCDILTQTVVNKTPDIKLFPNPLIGDILTIQIPGNKNQRPLLQVSDVYGKVLSESKIETGTFNMDIGGLSQGVYVIKVLQENQELLIKKILKI